MNFNDKYLSIPPYLSTTWDNILALQMEESYLKITMKYGTVAFVPDLDMLEIEALFSAHESYLKEKIEPKKDHFSQFSEPVQKVEIPFKIGFGSIENMKGLLQHNPEFANAPDMPPEVLNKIGAIAKILSPSESLDFPPPEPHCNCPHCQISRAVFHPADSNVLEDPSEIEAFDIDAEVNEEELQFNQWDILTKGEQLYQVINKLDANEKYLVYLGKPISCTCTNEGCEHVLAVLKS